MNDDALPETLPVQVGDTVEVHAQFTTCTGGVVVEVNKLGFRIVPGQSSKGLWFGWHELVRVSNR